MKYFNLISISLLFAILLSACSDDDANMNVPEPPEGDFVNGKLVLHEGSFGGVGNITFISDDRSEIKRSIFQEVNPDEDLGELTQSIFFHDGLAYIISGGSNFITVVDRFTFEKVGEVAGGLENPRYGTVLNNKAYVTNSATFDSLTDDYVAVIDLESLAVENTIELGNIAEQIISYDQKLYVMNADGFDGSEITIIDPAELTTETLDIGEGLNSIKRNDNSIYALSNSNLTEIDLSTESIVNTQSVPDAISGAKNLDLTDSKIYYTFENKVYRSDYSDSTLSDNEFITYNSTSGFGTMYGFDVIRDEIYVADAVDFASNGFVRIYDIDGNFIEEIEVELGPNSVYRN